MNTLQELHCAVSQHKKKHQRGIAAVELTICLPLLLLLLFIAGEMGRWLYQYNTLTKATETGARYLATKVRMAPDLTELNTSIDEAKNLVRYGSLTATTQLLPGPNTVTVDVDTDATGANPIIVTATYTYDPMVFPDNLTIPLWQNLNLAVPLTTRVEMPRL